MRKPLKQARPARLDVLPHCHLSPLLIPLCQRLYHGRMLLRTGNQPILGRLRLRGHVVDAVAELEG